MDCYNSICPSNHKTVISWTSSLGNEKKEVKIHQGAEKTKITSGGYNIKKLKILSISAFYEKYL